MKNKLRRTGFVFATVFVLAYFMNLANSVLSGDEFWFTIASPTKISLLAIASVLYLSAFIDKLRWIQPVVFLGASALPIMQDTDSIFGAGCFLIGLMLLERAGFFLKHRLPRALAVLGYFVVLEGGSLFLAKEGLYNAVSACFFMVAFGVFVWLLYKDRLVVYLAEPKTKPALSLGERGLTAAERSYVRELLAGKQQKEIAIDFELSESTVRNTLAHAYKKLGVDDKVGLALLGERFDLVD